MKRFMITDGIAVAETGIDPDASGIDPDVAAGVKSASRRAEIMAVRLMVAGLFGPGCTLCHEPSGEPFLTKRGVRSGLLISISHCRGLAAVAYSESRRVGLDVERERRQAVRIRSKFLSAAEMEATGESVWKNTLAWTAKEALFKCVPEDGVDFSLDLAVDLAGVEEKAAVSEYAATAFGRPYRLKTLYDGSRLLTVAFPA